MRNRSASVIVENNKVALIKRIRDGKVYYVFPGGGIEQDESPEQAAVRETFEELGLHINIIKDFGVVHFNGRQYYFLSEIVGGTFGTGTGEEFTHKDRNRGTYEPVWIELDLLLSLDVRPLEIAKRVHSTCSFGEENAQRLQPIDAASRFIEEHFPECNAALLAGSVIRGQATETSDLDIIVFDEKVVSPYRESLIEQGWPIEVFAYNLSSYKNYFKSNYELARPVLIRMVSEGLIITDSGVIHAIKKEAEELLKKGPAKWSEDTILTKRYMITDALNDLIGCTNYSEELFIANALAEAIHEFVLRTNGEWIGASKWVVRSLNQFDEAFTTRFVQSFDTFYKTRNKVDIIKLTDEVLEPYGGRLFEGYSVGKS